jgi:peptide/nickel transport system permease protein
MVEVNAAVDCGAARAGDNYPVGIEPGGVLGVHLTGDPALYLLGPEGTKQDYEQLKKNLGLDKPLPVQYALFLANVIQGDFGDSHITGQSARETLMERFLATLELAGAAFLLSG